MVLAGLAAAIEELELPADASVLAEALALRDRLYAKVTAALGRFDAAQLWDAAGATSLTAWLRDAGDRSLRQAAVSARTARDLQAWPVTAAAFEAGELSGGQVDVIVALVGRRHRDRFATGEASLVPQLAGLSVADTHQVLVEWRDAVDNLDPAPPPPIADEVRFARDPDGRMVLRGDLDPATGDLVEAALAAADRHDDELTLAQRRADALAQVCAAFLGHQRCTRPSKSPVHLHLVVTPDQLAGLSCDDAVAACDAIVHRLLVSDRGVVLDHGRGERLFTDAQKVALALRDRGCRFPGCDRPASWCDAHHVDAWETGGATDLSNGVLLCRRHHRIAHRPGWTLRLTADGELHATDPTGRTRTTRPALTPDRLRRRRRRPPAVVAA